MKTVEQPLRHKKEYFDTVAQEWEANTPEQNREILQYTIDETTNDAPGKTVLDIGCGTGVSFPFLNGFDVIAFDLSSNMIEKAKMKTTSSLLTLLQADAHRIPLRNETIDSIICIAVYPHIIDKSLFLDECYRVLRRDGTMGIIHLAPADEINRLHMEAGGVVENDILPETDEVVRQLEATGFQPTHVENDTFYFIAAQK